VFIEGVQDGDGVVGSPVVAEVQAAKFPQPLVRASFGRRLGRGDRLLEFLNHTDGGVLLIQGGPEGCGNIGVRVGLRWTGCGFGVRSWFALGTPTAEARNIP